MGHISDLKRNFIFLSTIDSKGYKFASEGGVRRLAKVPLFWWNGKRRPTQLYVLHGPKITDDATVTIPSLKGDDVTRTLAYVSWAYD